MRTVLRLLTLTMVLTAMSCGGGDEEATPCASDLDCKGDRICVDGTCEDPATGEGEAEAEAEAEAEGEDTLCPNGIVEGSYTIENSSDAADLVACTTIAGYLIVQADGLTALDLPELTSVSGLYVRQDTNGFTNAALTAVDMPALTSVGGDIDINRNARLTTLSLPALASAGGYLYIYQNPVLPTCEAEAIRDQLLAGGGFVGAVDIHGNDDLGTCP